MSIFIKLPLYSWPKSIDVKKKLTIEQIVSTWKDNKSYNRKLKQLLQVWSPDKNF